MLYPSGIIHLLGLYIYLIILSSICHTYYIGKEVLLYMLSNNLHFLIETTYCFYLVSGGDMVQWVDLHQASIQVCQEGTDRQG